MPPRNAGLLVAGEIAGAVSIARGSGRGAAERAGPVARHRPRAELGRETRLPVDLDAVAARAAGVPEGGPARGRLERDQLVFEVDVEAARRRERPRTGARADLDAGRVLRLESRVEAAPSGFASSVVVGIWNAVPALGVERQPAARAASTPPPGLQRANVRAAESSLPGGSATSTSKRTCRSARRRWLEVVGDEAAPSAGTARRRHALVLLEPERAARAVDVREAAPIVGSGPARRSRRSVCAQPRAVPP